LSLQEKYLQACCSSTAIFFFANDCSEFGTKFVLNFLPQNQHPGFMVDIRSLANDKFLSEFNGFVMADSSDKPPNKFLILPVVDGQ
jgi:predicted adenine nucleotide alpha hydrolase (AANH) superfamily ATPase